MKYYLILFFLILSALAFPSQVTIRPSGGGGVSDHSLLTNLTADDHLQYLRTDGTRALTGNQSFGNNSALDIGQLEIDDGVNAPYTFTPDTSGRLQIARTSAGQSTFDLLSTDQDGLDIVGLGLFHVGNTNAANKEGLAIFTLPGSPSTMVIQSFAAGTGVVRDLDIYMGSSAAFRFESTGDFTLMGSASKTFSIEDDAVADANPAGTWTFNAPNKVAGTGDGGSFNFVIGDGPGSNDSGNFKVTVQDPAGSVEVLGSTLGPRLRINGGGILDFSGADGYIRRNGQAQIQLTSTSTIIERPFDMDYETASTPGAGYLRLFAQSDDRMYHQTSGGVLDKLAVTDEVMLLDGTQAMTGNLNLGANVLQVSGTQVVTARQTGYTDPTGTTDRGTYDTATVTTADLAEFVKAMYEDLKTHGLIGN